MMLGIVFRPSGRETGAHFRRRVGGIMIGERCAEFVKAATA
jgi:hypothetical protein